VPGTLSRRDFLKVGGTGLAGAALLGAAGCGGGEQGGGATELYSTVSPYYSDMSLEMKEQFNASLVGDISPDEAARTLKEQLENFIQQGKES
jgi:ABC-type glycerol-3-phosphate transport system substrate-binding protein